MDLEVKAMDLVNDTKHTDSRRHEGKHMITDKKPCQEENHDSDVVQSMIQLCRQTWDETDKFEIEYLKKLREKMTTCSNNRSNTLRVEK